ncbi:MAG: ribonuclease E activity regulator RraA [Nocardioidaceae bacterium]|nr:ribonuclease E activity regulator RraA [Nocardioidaceae bacterium]
MDAATLLADLAAGRVGTADVVDDLGEDARSCDVQLRSYGGREAFGGPVRTVKVYEDNALVKSTLSTDGGGAVLVVDGGHSLHSALVGDVIAALAVEHGWAGVVAFGAIRDVKAMATLDLGVVALGSNPRKSSKTGAGQSDVPVHAGGVTFTTDDHVLVDADGVLVVATDVLA